MGQVTINGRTVTFDDPAAELGIHHLFTLEFGERESAFNAARAAELGGKGFLFEDHEGRNFTLTRVKSGVYHLIRRGSD